MGLLSANNTLYYCLSTCSVSTNSLVLAASAPHEKFLATMVGTEPDGQAGGQRRCKQILIAEQPFQLCWNPDLVRDMIIKTSEPSVLEPQRGAASVVQVTRVARRRNTHYRHGYLHFTRQ